MRQERIVVLGDGRWHADALSRAFAARGARAHRLPFASLSFAADVADGLRLGQLPALPDAVLVRSIPAGSFEQITLRLGLLHALEALGVTVVNPPRAIERAVDKAATSFSLRRAGVPTPPFWVAECRSRALAVVATECSAGHRLVCKPLFGAQGKGLKLVCEPADLPAAEEVAGVWYLQRFVGSDRDWHDYRVLVIDGEPVAAMRRRGTSWITNIRRGARPEPVGRDAELEELAVAAACAIGTFFCGVDLIRAADGRAQVLEVNGMPAWSGLQSVCTVDLADRLAAAILHRLRRKGAP